MIEVIEERPKRKCECPCCFSKLSYGREDIKVESLKTLYSYDNSSGYIICPVCGKTIYIIDKSLNLGCNYKTNKKLKEVF